MRVCVIGAGAAGICAAKNGIEFGCDVIVFEQTSEIGGTWVYTDEIGKDKNGLDVHSSMYQGLYTNLPKEVMGYPDFQIPPQERSYISSQDMLQFINSYAEKFDVRKLVKFEHHVVKVRPLSSSSWEVVVRNLPAKVEETFVFDAVMVCNGHYNTPTLPKYEGFDSFKGKHVHSHDFRNAELFRGAAVLVIGAGPSGIDLANEISKVAQQVTLSHHLREPPKTVFRHNVDQKPDVARITADGAIFNDGSSQNFSIIFYCTGYQYTFPFLSDDCGIKCEDNFVRPLYKHCLSIHRPSLGFIGLPFYVCALQMFDLQARFCLTFMTRSKDLPPKDEMLNDHNRDMNERWAKGMKTSQAHLMGHEQHKYYADLAATAQIKPLQNVISKLHNFSSLRFLDDLINFRREVFRILDDETFIRIGTIQ
jgi:dimethylaniline monooxygenase (N-oxide forming)